MTPRPVAIQPSERVIRLTVALSLLAIIAFPPQPAHSRVITRLIDANGDGAGNTLDWAEAVAADAAGNVYVTGRFSDNAFKIDPNGVITEIIDASGDSEGNTLDLAMGIAVDGAGNVYVAGSVSDNAFQIDPNGLIREIIGPSGDGAGNPLNGAHAIAADESGNVYVTGSGSDNAFRIDPNGTITEIIDASAGGAGTLDIPKGIAVDASGNVYVTGESIHSVFRIDPNGVVTKILGYSGDGAGNVLLQPVGITADPAGNVYVAGVMSNNAFKIDPDGVVTEIIDRTGDGGGNELYSARGIAVDASGTVYVVGSGSHNAFRIDPDGGITEIIDAGTGGAGTLRGPRGIALDGLLNVYVVGAASNNAFKIDLTCGNAALDPGEECDDGNFADGDGCSAQCLVEFCGDGSVNDAPHEECDDGNNASGDGCSAACQLELPQHYKCYKVKQVHGRCRDGLSVGCNRDEDCASLGANGCQQRFPRGVQARLADAFESEAFDLRRPRDLCTPAEKDGEEISDPDLHLEAYPIKRRRGAPELVKQRVLMRDQYGDHILEIFSERLLLVPTSKDPNAPVGLPTSVSDHFKCYQAREIKRRCTGDFDLTCSDRPEQTCAAQGVPEGECHLGFPRGTRAVLGDQFETRTHDLKRPTLLCTPVDKHVPPGDPNGTGILRPDVHLVGYRIGTARGDPKHARIAGIHTNNQFGPEVLSTRREDFLLVPAELNPPVEEIGIGEHECVIDFAHSSLKITGPLPLPAFDLTGAIDIDCKTKDWITGRASCTCALQYLDPIEVVGIGQICFSPGATCSAGEIDCDGGTPLDVDMHSNHTIGVCTSNPDCSAQCDSYCAGLAPSHTRFFSGCGGFCLSGANDGLPCTADVGCPGGSCPGKDGLPHGNECQCDCLSVGGSGVPSRAGGLYCQLPAEVNIEIYAPCGGGDVLIALGTRCIPLTTETKTSQFHNWNDTPGFTWPQPPFQATGSPIGCEILAESTTTGLVLVGAVNFFDSTIGDVDTNEVFTCF